MQRRTNRGTTQSIARDRRQTQPVSDTELLPWADPYIVGLMREHERQMRGFEQANGRTE
ncbi:MAG: hypothetical protein SGJ20_10070 [Planctomycetota bacterium]|nr:hypothetical protein [Planctomycetota bacterium]